MQTNKPLKNYKLRVTSTQIKYCNVTAKSLEEAVAQAEYQMLVNPVTELDGTLKQIKSYELVDLPNDPMIIDEDYLEFTDKEKNDAKKKERNTETRESF